MLVAELSHLYKFICAELGWPEDSTLLQNMLDSNKKHMEELEAKIKDAEENLGESEVREAFLAKADFLAKIGDKESALVAYAETEKKTVAMGQRMDLVFSILRCSLPLVHRDWASSDTASDLAFRDRMQIFFGEWHSVRESIEKCKRLFEEGGDWERKNRLKVYESLYFMSTRSFKMSADLFLDSIATFTTCGLSISRPFSQPVPWSLDEFLLSLWAPAFLTGWLVAAADMSSARTIPSSSTQS